MVPIYDLRLSGIRFYFYFSEFTDEGLLGKKTFTTKSQRHEVSLSIIFVPSCLGGKKMFF
ncbi:MAG: hypothetical protein C0393_08465 [Anaerolinea sp.]|nr:hypothetical protein [Anaerolinea sp.]